MALSARNRQLLDEGDYSFGFGFAFGGAANPE
jgi:hypothetical protein